MTQPGAERHLMAEIAREGDVAHIRIAFRQGLDLGERRISRAVIHEHDFVAAERRRNSGERGGHRRHIQRLVMGGQHERKLGSRLIH